MNILKTLCHLIALVLFTTQVSSIAAATRKDLKDSNDHPIIERFPGSIITKYQTVNFDRYSIPLSTPEWANSVGYETNDTLDLEGKITKIVYTISSETSNYEIYKNYLNAFQNDNFEIVKTCYEDACNGFAKNYVKYIKQKLVGGIKDKALPYYTIAKNEAANGVTYVILLNANAGRNNHIIVHIIETKELELGQVSTNANALMDSLNMNGKAEIYDIYFDTGKSNIKPESEAAIKAIVDVLNKDSSLHLYVVGHTDDTGSIAANNKLSINRSKALVKNLIDNHGLNGNRLYPTGVGPFAPLATNHTPEGRAKNRRVELVKRIIKKTNK